MWKIFERCDRAAAAEFVCRRVMVAVEQASKGLDDMRRSIFYEALELIAGNLRRISAEGLPENS